MQKIDPSFQTPFLTSNYFDRTQVPKIALCYCTPFSGVEYRLDYLRKLEKTYFPLFNHYYARDQHRFTVIEMWPRLIGFWIEMKCPKHGLERFKIKVIKRFNMPAETIQPKFRSRPKPGGLSCVYVGRDISETEIRKYLIDYLRKRGLWEKILTMHLKKV